MSIEAAAKELTKEIERLNKEAERLTKLRDALSVGTIAAAATVGRGASKKAVAKKSAAKPVPVPPAKKKRVMSAEGRKAIADDTRRRWALKKKADATTK